jgi:pimeloyl-ACP methyl ester carboxylesterase
LITATTNVLNAVRRDGIAAAQVDVVAHSLGGLIARSRAALRDAERAYLRPENFQRGDFHKLISVGTPHRGTPVADFLISNRCVRSSFFQGRTLEEYFASIGRPFGRAIEELRTVSPAITNVGATTGIRSHAIVGIAPGKSPTEGLLSSLPRALGYSLTLDDLLGGNRNHDTIVPRSSQAGGLPRSAVTLARGTVHADVDVRDTGETESRFIRRRIAQLLRAPAASKIFGNFTALETNAVAIVSQPCLE